MAKKRSQHLYVTRAGLDLLTIFIGVTFHRNTHAAKALTTMRASVLNGDLISQTVPQIADMMEKSIDLFRIQHLCPFTERHFNALTDYV